MHILRIFDIYVIKRLADGNYLTYEHVKNVASKAVIQLGEIQSDN